MSKAFTKEDDLGEIPLPPRPASLLPPGTKNYLTIEGERQLRAKLAHAITIERPPLTAQPDDPDAKRELRLLDQRILQLQEGLQTAEIVPPPPLPHDTVQFGATVTVRETANVTNTYTIVGVDEAEYELGRISWLSPLARALLQSRVGTRVTFKTLAGLNELEIVRIAYPPTEPKPSSA